VLGTAQGSFALLKYLSPLADIMQGLFFRFADFFLSGQICLECYRAMVNLNSNRTRTTGQEQQAGNQEQSHCFTSVVILPIVFCLIQHEGFQWQS
jgi:hypothetical protein